MRACASCQGRMAQLGVVRLVANVECMGHRDYGDIEKAATMSFRRCGSDRTRQKCRDVRKANGEDHWRRSGRRDSYSRMKTGPSSWRKWGRINRKRDYTIIKLYSSTSRTPSLSTTLTLYLSGLTTTRLETSLMQRLSVSKPSSSVASGLWYLRMTSVRLLG